MPLLDFFMYYLTLYYIKRPQTVSWSSPEQRAIYAVSLITTSWLLSLEFCLFIYVFKPINPDYLFFDVLAAFGLMWIYEYIYVKEKRLEVLRSSGFKFFNLNDNLCISMAWIGLIVSFALPFAVLVLSM